MKWALVIALAIAAAWAPTDAFAYRTTKANGAACVADGSACNVYCNSNTLAGTMYWNGTRWSDGVRSNVDKDVVAREIVAAQGTACV